MNLICSRKIYHRNVFVEMSDVCKVFPSEERFEVALKTGLIQSVEKTRFDGQFNCIDVKMIDRLVQESNISITS